MMQTSNRRSFVPVCVSRQSILMHSHLTSWCHSVQHQCHWGALWEDSEGSCHRQMLEKNGIVTACIKQRVKWSVTALSSIMTLTSVLSECISKKVAILRQNSATLRLKALSASYIIHIFARKMEKKQEKSVPNALICVKSIHKGISCKDNLLH